MINMIAAALIGALAIVGAVFLPTTPAACIVTAAGAVVYLLHRAGQEPRTV